MDPRIVQLLQMIQQSQGGQGAPAGQGPTDMAQGAPQGASQGAEGGPDANGNGVPDGFEGFANANPFEGALDGFDQSQGGGPEGPMGGGPAGRPQMGGPMESAEGEPMPNQLRKGENPDSSGPLLSATQQLQKYITGSTDDSEIAVARSIIALIARLIERDQAAQSENLPLDKDALANEPAAPPAPAAPAAPAGPPTPPAGPAQ